MQVTVSVAGRFHAFYLAQQLLKQGHLQKLITSYPRFEVAKYNIPPDKTEHIIIREIFITISGSGTAVFEKVLRSRTLDSRAIR